MRTAWRHLLWGLLLGLGTGCGADKPPAVVAAERHLPDTVDFNLHVRPLLADRCFSCHGPDENAREAGLRLDLEEGALGALPESPGRAVVPRRLSKSELWRRITSSDPEVRMPPPSSNLRLAPEEVALLGRWIEQGAVWKPHWAFLAPARPAPPPVQEAAWVRNDIDRFVLARLQRAGLRPQPEADRETLLRRVSFDLTGLPPTVEEIDAFLADTSEDAYERVVDRLLASPHYGERRAVEWMDLARFADTHGYTVDRARDMSPWRDWVIRAFNENLPFDRFVTWQLAGDLLPNPTKEQVLATGFNRLHAQNVEGGIISEEFRVEYVADRVNTFGKAFLGLTMECARCHDHKFDPVTQQEYYELFSFFNNVDESGQISWDDAMPVPTILVPDEEAERRLTLLRAQVDRKEAEVAALAARKEGAFAQWLAAGGAAAALPEGMPEGLVAYFPLEEVTTDRIPNRAHPARPGEMVDPVTWKRSEAAPTVVEGRRGRGLRLSGDDALYFPKVGVFGRAEPFSIGLWVQVPADLRDGVIFHKNDSSILYNFRGYHLAVEEGMLHLVLAHTFPYNALHLVYTGDLPRERWVHLMMTYDGSSRAAGLTLYVDGEGVPTEVRRDRLYKDLLLGRGEDEPGLSIGARSRSKGFTNGRVDEIVVFDRALTGLEVAALAGRTEPLDAVRAASVRPAAGQLSGAGLPSGRVRRLLFEHYLARRDRELTALRRELQRLRAELNRATEPVPEVMVMAELDVPRQAYVLERGVYDAYGEAVQPGTPARLGAFPDTLRPDRLGLARWLTHPDHPTLARVTVNRYWQQYFGRGLVGTPDDFGSQGELPTHPALLDWLARAFVASGWDVKGLQRLIVTSATYRQASTADPALRARDPDNRLLARGPVRRLTAEMLRDQVLAASGLLVPRIGGPSVKPYQPEGLWRVNSGQYVQDTGEGLYRRSLYTFIKRTVPPPTMNLFDAPDRSYCVVRRQRTSTPLQSLALMNDPQFVEAARRTAERVLREGGPDPEAQVTYAFRLLTGRRPTAAERDLLVRLHAEQRARFGGSTGRARALLAVGESPPDPALNPVDVASHAVVVSTIMNYDAAQTLR